MRTRSMAVGRQGRQRGLATVEFAIVAPLLVLLLVGVAEFGRALYQYNTLTKSVRNAARYLADNSLGGSLGFVVLSGTHISEAKNLVVYGNTGGVGSPLIAGLDTSDVSISSPDPQDVTVSVTYTYQPMTASTLPVDPISLAIPLKASITMRGL